MIRNINFCNLKKIHIRITSNLLNKSHIRQLSTKDIFGGIHLQSTSTSNGLSNLIPDQPISVPKKELEELMKSGESVLEELDLWSFYKPSSYFRWGLESMHYWIDIPWWSTIIIGNFIFLIKNWHFKEVIITMKVILNKQ